MFYRNKAEFFSRFIATDETWVHSLRRRRIRNNGLKGRIGSKEDGTIPSLLWDARRIIFMNYFQNGKTMKEDYYANLLQPFNYEIKKNGRIIAITKISELQLLPHAPFSPHLAPSDYLLFPNLKKKWFRGKRFANNRCEVCGWWPFWKARRFSLYTGYRSYWTSAVKVFRSKRRLHSYIFSIVLFPLLVKQALMKVYPTIKYNYTVWKCAACSPILINCKEESSIMRTSSQQMNLKDAGRETLVR